MFDTGMETHKLLQAGGRSHLSRLPGRGYKMPPLVDHECGYQIDTFLWVLRISIIRMYYDIIHNICMSYQYYRKRYRSFL